MATISQIKTIETIIASRASDTPDTISTNLSFHAMTTIFKLVATVTIATFDTICATLTIFQSNTIETTVTIDTKITLSRGVTVSIHGLATSFHWPYLWH